jgi:hypothetical protein
MIVFGAPRQRGRPGRLAPAVAAPGPPAILRDAAAGIQQAQRLS